MRGFFKAAVQAFAGGHDGEDHARYRKVQVADEQTDERVGKHPALPGQLQTECSEDALPTGQQNHQKADHHAGKRQRKGQQCHQRRASKKMITGQKHTADAADQQRHKRHNQRQQTGLRQTAQVLSTAQYLPVAAAIALGALRTEQDQMSQRQQPEGQQYRHRRSKRHCSGRAQPQPEKPVLAQSQRVFRRG
ncbi:hypothetical protein ALP75_203602 [Pseudomonas syringae pv. actinidiae]|nr:hypothetical protein ALP75_203602 [Pseudomonas syringae pv. actinidiae]